MFFKQKETEYVDIVKHMLSVLYPNIEWAEVKFNDLYEFLDKELDVNVMKKYFDYAIKKGASR